MVGWDGWVKKAYSNLFGSSVGEGGRVVQHFSIKSSNHIIFCMCTQKL